MSNLELQNEEREVLLSIYDGDPAFKELTPTVFQYKVGEHEHIKSFLLELQWSENYPAEKPIVNMNTFYNRNIIATVKNKVIDLVSNEAEQYLGEAMTYSLIECVKEKYDELVEDQPEDIVQEANEAVEKVNISNKEEVVVKKPPKKEQLSKAQKRRQWDRVEAKGEKPRGWDWVDIVKHLSQTGSKDSNAGTTTGDNAPATST